MTSLATTYSGAEVTGSRTLYYPYGEQRWSASGGTLPTDFTYTGQRADSYTQLIHMGARWYDAQIGRWISADTIVPDPGNPQDLNRYSYVGGNPLRYVDPSGHQGIPAWLEDLLGWLFPEGSSAPDEALSSNEAEVVGEIQAYAQELLDAVQSGEITDCEALVRTMEFAAQQHHRGGFWFIDFGYDEEGYLRDLGLVLGGIRTVYVGFEGGHEYGDEDAIRTYFYERTHFANNPLSAYYVPGFDSTGFLEEYAETGAGANQVRHFMGGLVGGSAWWGQGRDFLLERETPGSADYMLHEKAFELADDLSVEEGGQWVRDNICQR